MRSLVLALLVSFAATAAEPPLRLDRRDRREYRDRRAASALPLFQFAPASGAGLPFVSGLCDTLSPADKVGAWECLNGDGTSSAWDGGTGTFSAEGSVASQTMSQCPNGPSCGNVTRQVHEANEGHETAAYASGTDSFTACWLGTQDGAGANTQLFTHSTGGATATISWYMEATSGGAFRCYVSDGTTAASPSAPIGITVSAVHLACCTWDGAEGVRACQDGSCSAPTARATRQSLSAPLNVHGVNGSSSGITTTHRTQGAFVTRTKLSTTRIAEIARAVLADTPTGSRGEAVTVTRATAATCENAAGTELTVLPSGRHCGTQGGILVERAGTSLVLRSEEFDNAAWTAVGTPGETADTTVAPSGALVGDTIEDNDGAAFEGEQQTLTTTASAAYALSVYVKAGTSTKLRLSNDGTVCDFTVTSSWARYACADASASGTSTVQQVLIGNATSDTGTIVLFGAQFESGSRVTSYITTTSASATRNKLVAAMAVPSTASWPSSWAITLIDGQFGVHANDYGMTTGSSGAVYSIAQSTSTTNFQCAIANTAAATDDRSVASFDDDDRFACVVTATTLEACVNGTCSGSPTAHAISSYPFTSIQIGDFTTFTPQQPNGVLKQVCWDSNPARCR